MRRSMFRRALPVLAFAAALPFASAANAAVYLFTLSGPNSASFSLDASPTPASTGTNFFQLQNVPGTYNGSPTTFTQLLFYNSSGEGGLSVDGLGLIGPQLFTGTLTSPTFVLGTFSLSDSEFGLPNYSLSITNGAVPEPATWAMMLIGFAGIGLTVRHRKAKVRQLA